MKKILFSLLAMFLCLNASAQEEAQIERMYTFGLVQEMDANMNVTQEAPAQGIVVIGISEGSRQMAFAVGEEPLYDLTVIEQNVEEEEGKTSITYVCKNNLEEDGVLYNVMEFFTSCNPDVPAGYLVSAVDPENMTVIMMQHFGEIQPAQ